MRARRAGTPPRGQDGEESHRSWRGGGPARLGTVVSCPTARAARLGAPAPNTPKETKCESARVRKCGGFGASPAFALEDARRTDAGTALSYSRTFALSHSRTCYEPQDHDRGRRALHAGGVRVPLRPRGVRGPHRR